MKTSFNVESSASPLGLGWRSRPTLKPSGPGLAHPRSCPCELSRRGRRLTMLHRVVPGLSDRWTWWPRIAIWRIPHLPFLSSFRGLRLAVCALWGHPKATPQAVIQLFIRSRSSTVGRRKRHQRRRFPLSPRRARRADLLEFQNHSQHLELVRCSSQHAEQ